MSISFREPFIFEKQNQNGKNECLSITYSTETDILVTIDSINIDTIGMIEWDDDVD